MLAHPQWLNTFLYEYAGPTSPSSPQAWVCEMLCWTLQAASKRCAHQLQSYVAACLRQHIILGADGGGMGQSSQQQQPGRQQQAERALRQALPPLGQALVGVVEQLVLLVRDKLPRGNQGQFLFPHDPPTEPVRVLLAYAESSPWAAAHLLQVSSLAWAVGWLDGEESMLCSPAHSICICAANRAEQDSPSSAQIPSGLLMWLTCTDLYCSAVIWSGHSVSHSTTNNWLMQYVLRCASAAAAAVVCAFRCSMWCQTCQNTSLQPC